MSISLIFSHFVGAFSFQERGLYAFMQPIRNIRRIKPVRLKLRTKLALTYLCFAIPLYAISQDKMSDCKDCKSLNEVQVFGFSPERFMSGLKVQKVDSINLTRFQYQNLGDFLQFQTPIAFKSYGAGQATSISFRGTSANHTAILWNGLNINSPTLGQSDFSTIPLLGFDKMSIQYGSAASCIGSDAVGGSILLSSSPNLTKESFNTVLGGQIGGVPFGNFGYNANAGIRSMKIYKHLIFGTKTLFYGGIFNNKFEGLHTSRTDKKGHEYPIEPSETNQKGLVQDLYFKSKNHIENLFYINLWLSSNTLTIQPQIIDFREITQTQAYRFLTGFQIQNTSLKAGFIRDILDYGKGEFLDPSKSKTDRFILRGEHDFIWDKTKLQILKQSSIRIGSEFVHYATKVDGYGSNLIHENRGDLYALIRYNFSSKINSSINLRQALSSRYKAPFTPSLGLDFKLITKQNTQILLTGSIAKSYRLPTLNERYWKVLGNIDIKPEQGLNKEIGVEWKQLYGSFYKSSIGISAFHNLIKDWTYWNPDRNYRVENLQEVLSKGLEITSSIKFNNFELQKTAGIILSYALTNASQQKVYDSYAIDIIGKQLIYVPRHAVSGNAYYGHKQWNLGLQGIFNSERYITFDHSGQPFPSYFIFNTTFNYKTKVFQQEINLVLQANNLTNTVYPNIKKNAMPGRTFQLALIFNFNK
ncbi:TonB-dependent receptor [Emticicia sp. SJ17W-69]|uniref:TonB-dependent receptor n=1 Tax=Emticicia sp. SJ17W-69 TaxID=3421657 RepID=UPI003EB8BBAB